MRFLKPHHIEWITSTATLERQVSLSLTDRCRDFLREWSGVHMNPTLLRQVYKKKGIKKKKYRFFKDPRKKDPAKYRRDLLTMRRQLTRARHEGYRFIYLDECMFSRKTLPDTEWARPNENVRVDQANLDEPTLALLSAVSKEKG